MATLRTDPTGAVVLMVIFVIIVCAAFAVGYIAGLATVM
ncbi:hypothetical protein QIL25_gp3 [ssRNA phage SRR5208570_4]|uniref:Uncharacterized protein n=1 Tax=ssRNA phage SRR5208570_4 TaxID=2786381 RepID=A0A8S5L568_9VIRU|nr:hypothetical protein QIL25_gp3 [ssRNA phage SRR5208570_4]DAD52346.1 TPA_asm: hypothetical protein [ssRNA phage SRR5208570_4]